MTCAFTPSRGALFCSYGGLTIYNVEVGEEGAATDES